MSFLSYWKIVNSTHFADIHCGIMRRRGRSFKMTRDEQIGTIISAETEPCNTFRKLRRCTFLRVASRTPHPVGRFEPINCQCFRHRLRRNQICEILYAGGTNPASLRFIQPLWQSFSRHFTATRHSILFVKISWALCALIIPYRFEYR